MHPSTSRIRDGSETTREPATPVIVNEEEFDKGQQHTPDKESEMGR